MQKMLRLGKAVDEVQSRGAHAEQDLAFAGHRLAQLLEVVARCLAFARADPGFHGGPAIDFEFEVTG